MFRRPPHVLLPWVLVPLTFLIFFKSLDEIGPHDEDVCISWNEILDRAPLGYATLPPYDATYGFTPWNGGDQVGWFGRDRKSTRLNSSHLTQSRMPSSA